MTVRQLLTVAAVLLGGANARAGFLTTNSNEHSDIAFFFENGVLTVGGLFEDRDPPEEYAAGEVLHFAAPGFSRVTLPAGFGFLGTAGSTAFVLPQTQNPNLPFIGIGAEDLDPADFLPGSSLGLQFVGVRGPGDFAVWQSDEFGGPPNVFYSSLSGGPGVSTPVGGHDHYNFGFSAAGVYEVDVVGSGTLADGTVVTTGTTTLFFGIEAVPTPAPPAAVLFVFGGAALGLARAVRRRLM